MNPNAFQEKMAKLDREITQLSLSEEGLESFFHQFLEKIVSILGVGGAVWQCRSGNELKRLCHINLAPAGMDDNGAQNQLLGQVLSQVHQSDRPVILGAHDASNIYDGGAGEAFTNNSPHTLMFLPITAGVDIEAIFFLIAPTDVDPRAVKGYSGFVQELCKGAGRFLERMKINELRTQINKSDRLRDYFSALHSGLNPKRTCFALANYAQEFLGVYRCMAGSFNSAGKFKMLSVSGLESVAVKSSFIKSISDIARQVCRNNKVLLVDNPNAVLSSKEDSVGDDLISESRLYMLQAKSMAMGVFPIVWEKQVVGALVVEKAKEEPIDSDQRQQVETLLIEAGGALSNGLIYSGQPLSWFVRPLARLRDKIYRMERGRRLFWITAWVLLILLPFVVPKQVKVIGQAELVPVQARIAYARQDGLVEAIDVPEDRQVQAGHVLASMDVRIVEAELDRVSNAISETQIALEEASSRNKLQAQRLKSQLKSLAAEQKKYFLERQQFEIISPVTGTVITRKDELRLLLSKPLLRGEAVMTVVPQDTLWELTVDIPEDKAGQLLRAFDQLPAGQHLTARVILNAYPDMVFSSHVLSVAPRASVVTVGEQKYTNVIEVRIAEPAELRDRLDPREGLEGKVAIECGKHSLFFALTHEFFNFVRISLF